MKQSTKEQYEREMKNIDELFEELRSRIPKRILEKKMLDLSHEEELFLQEMDIGFIAKKGQKNLAPEKVRWNRNKTDANKKEALERKRFNKKTLSESNTLHRRKSSRLQEKRARSQIPSLAPSQQASPERKRGRRNTRSSMVNLERPRLSIALNNGKTVHLDLHTEPEKQLGKYDKNVLGEIKEKISEYTAQLRSFFSGI
ncbi:MAG: uncharacterized protein A8A55_0763 [Amphiamblys sp. WSBS2006]|nr:MAG: uncharacterized protein A8A55_0763 [Amphiamblys sp. WSBS2006]